jgi:hypothetical protein
VLPGWHYLDSASGYLTGKGSYVSLRSPDMKDWSVVLETINAQQPQKVTFRLAGGLTGNEVHVWETNNSRTFEHVANVKVANDTFAFIFDPDSLYSLTNTTGQRRGTGRRRCLAVCHRHFDLPQKTHDLLRRMFLPSGHPRLLSYQLL